MRAGEVELRHARIERVDDAEAGGHGAISGRLTTPAVPGLGLGGNDNVPSFSAMTRRTIGFLVFPDFQLLDAAGPIAAFEIAGRYRQRRLRHLSVLAAEAGPVASSSGVDHGRRARSPDDAFDTLVVAGGDGTRAPAAIRPRWPSSAHARPRARRMASVCSGALRAGRGRPARRPARHHPLEPQPPTSRAAFPRCGSSPTASTCATARSGPRPGSPPASTWRWP